MSWFITILMKLLLTLYLVYRYACLLLLCFNRQLCLILSRAGFLVFIMIYFFSEGSEVTKHDLGFAQVDEEKEGMNSGLSGNSFFDKIGTAQYIQ